MTITENINSYSTQLKRTLNPNPKESDIAILWNKLKTGSTKPTAPYKDSEGLPLKYWLSSYHVLCDKVEHTILL